MTVYECWNCSTHFSGESCPNPECSTGSFTARIQGDGYDLQVCTSEPLTPAEREALHEFLGARRKDQE